MAVKTRVLSPEEAEQRQATLQKQEAAAARRDGADLAPQTTLDHDIAHLGDPQGARRPVRSVRRRQPDEVPLLYVKRRRGILSDGHLDLIVPDEDNAALVASLLEVVDPGKDSDGKPLPRPEAGDMAASGPSYHFIRGETTLVHEEDVPFFLAHPTWEFRRVDARDTADDEAPRGRTRRTTHG